MSVFRQKRPILITCPKGISSFLQQELQSLGFPIVSESIAAVETEGTMEDTMRLNLRLRTAHRVLYLMDTFAVKGPGELYGRMWDVGWEDFIAADGYVSVTSSVDHPTIRDARFANQKCKDAIVDRIKEKRGRRPDSGPERTGTVVHVYWRGERCSVYLDTSGEPLAKRGYRKIPLQAPMQETLAAAVVLATGWKGDDHFINPMCGSGTLSIEAALIGLNRAPGLMRKNFGFMHVEGFDGTRWRRLRSEARAQERKALQNKIVATDISPKAVEAARKNAAAAGVEGIIEFRACDFSQTPVPDGAGVIVLNPEYGERMGRVEQLKATYGGIGDFLKKKCQGYMGYIFTGNLDLAKHVGLRTTRRAPFYNGDIECRLLEYRLYEGSMKRKTART